ncbi:hypothetical protein QE250_07240 [Chromatiaceae bacterium AAb-1]|nr:hypothetical protein [Chromatiaceae bacterium AAb-1]
MEELRPSPEFSARHYTLLAALLILATAGNTILNWLFPALTGSVWTEMFPLLLGLYSLLLLFRELGIVRLPNVAYYSVLITPLSAVTLYQLVLH